MVTSNGSWLKAQRDHWRHTDQERICALQWLHRSLRDCTLLTLVRQPGKSSFSLMVVLGLIFSMALQRHEHPRRTVHRFLIEVVLVGDDFSFAKIE